MCRMQSMFKACKMDIDVCKTRIIRMYTMGACIKVCQKMRSISVLGKTCQKERSNQHNNGNINFITIILRSIIYETKEHFFYFNICIALLFTDVGERNCRHRKFRIPS